MSGQGRIVEGELALKALGHYRPSRALIAVDHIAEDGTLSVRNEVTAHLLSEAVAQSKRVIAIVASRPVYGEKRYAVGELQQISSVVTPQVVAAEYHACFLAAGLTNSYTNNECLTWLNTALHKTNRGAVMNVTICTIGELLVEFLAKEENQGFSVPVNFGALSQRGAGNIADQVAKLGFGSVLFSCVGNDAFGEMNIARLEKDGVNVNGIAMLRKRLPVAPSSAIVAGAARFYFNMPNSACGLLTADHIDEALLNQCQHFHIMGSSLFSFRIIDAMRKAIENIKGRSGTYRSTQIFAKRC